MSKCKIFDIEKVGFGDEHLYQKKVAPKTLETIIVKPEPVVQANMAKTNVTKTEVNKPQAKTRELTLERTTDRETEEINQPKIKQVTSCFTPNEFVSPIYGKMEDQSILTKLVHGNYDLSMEFVVEEDNNEGITDALLSETNVIEEATPLVTDSRVLEFENEMDELVEESPMEELDFDAVSIQTIVESTGISQSEQMTESELPKQNHVFVFSTYKKQETDKTEELRLDEALELESDLELLDSDFYNDVVSDDVPMHAEATVYYEIPSFDLLNQAGYEDLSDEDWLVEKMDVLEQTFSNFSVGVKLTGECTQGPTVTQIEIQPEPGTKVSKILSLENDLKLNLAVEYLRIEAPIPGKSTIGIEIPNRKRKKVVLREILSQPKFMLHESPLYVGLGQDIAGDPIYTNILTMPHGLIAGQTGSGKSVCINTLLLSVLYKASPEDVRIMLIDPKKVELAPYNDIPHLVTPVISDEKKAAIGLKWAVEEMERRYDLFMQNGVRDIRSFNDRRLEFEMDYEKLPYILIVIDELADLMMVSAQEVEDSIMRITQKARAAGIHMIVATQRPTVDVVTGTIKSNIPSRIAFAVAQGNDSKVILDKTGAESLLGAGDMLISESGMSKLKRVQGAYVSADEIDKVIAHVKKQAKPKYLIEETVFERGSSKVMSDSDPLMNEVTEFLIEQGAASASLVQRRFSVGYNRAARIIDTLEMKGFISKSNGTSSKPREVLITRSEFEDYIKDATRF